MSQFTIDLNVNVQDHPEAIEAAIKHLGWQIYAANVPTEKLSLNEAVLAYREQYIIERNFGKHLKISKV